MDRDDHEREALDLVCARLAERYPHLSPALIGRTVDEVHASLTGPIRDFVPVLVEHLAKDRLAAAPAVPA